MNGKKILSGSFWLVMAIHLIVFFVIGLTSGEWRLMWIFLPFLSLSIIIKYIIFYYKNKKNKS
jgi:phosphatidylserine synthase